MRRDDLERGSWKDWRWGRWREGGGRRVKCISILIRGIKGW